MLAQKGTFATRMLVNISFCASFAVTIFMVHGNDHQQRDGKCKACWSQKSFYCILIGKNLVDRESILFSQAIVDCRLG